jgi:undecaprenyl-diphosphatase
MTEGEKTGKDMTILDALVVGACQAVATIPGLSRSGTTITAGVATGLERSFAVKFSFLVSLPAILGANILSLVDAFREGVDPSLIPAYLLGTIAAGAVGYVCLGLVRALARRGKFGYFALYCWIVGFVTIILSIII